MTKTKCLFLAVTFVTMALTFSACAKKYVTEDFRRQIENTTQMTNKEIRYFVDRDIELKISKDTYKSEQDGKGIKMKVSKEREYILIGEGTAGICKETGDGVLSISFEPDYPNALLKFHKISNGDYVLSYEGHGLINYDGKIFEISVYPQNWFNFFSFASVNGREAKLKVNYDTEEEEAIVQRKAKGY